MSNKFRKWENVQQDFFTLLGGPNPDMGGTTGGERESNIRIACAWDPGIWPDGGPETPDCFWEYYLHEEVAKGYLKETKHGTFQGLEGHDSKERGGESPPRTQRPRGRQRSRNATQLP